ncbi:uncharacterized protein LOC128247259 [Octopus bimaculoides]|uniref:uncharacterized protein LOC128247259 n=1 Tax=Octopus bimaculoides TaxID=37653 RepID=UPI0022E56B82|nr:uncharacterized protein LOC128247259 [Octopus bimaculoides]
MSMSRHLESRSDNPIGISDTCDSWKYVPIYKNIVTYCKIYEEAQTSLRRVIKYKRRKVEAQEWLCGIENKCRRRCMRENLGTGNSKGRLAYLQCYFDNCSTYKVH